VVVITQEQFDLLLDWLDPDRELAGKKYETIRAGLIRVFVSKGFNDAEDLADETINRVIIRLPEMKDTYEGAPVRFFHGVARNIIREALRRKEVATDDIVVSVDEKPVTGVERECLDKCLGLLPEEKSDLILDYYLYEGHDKIEHHKRMAEKLGISDGALRGRAHHIRKDLEEALKRMISQKTKMSRNSL
jgi:RNA polymerase sigma factor (sigma-70 family)